jgi:hypothetical protein
MTSRPDRIPFRPDPSAVRNGQRTYDPRLRAAAYLARGHALQSDPSVLAKDDDAVGVVLRIAKNPTNIGTGGTAAQLAATKVVDDAAPLSGPSAGMELGRRGLRVEFGRAAAITIPTRVCNASDAGGFVAENDPIPVKVMALTGVSLTPTRLACIAVFSNDLLRTSNADRVVPQVRNEVGLLKYDAELFSATAASAGVRPAGLANGLTPITATTAGSEAMEKDIAALVAALATAGGGANPVFICAPPQAATLKLRAGARFDYPILPTTALANGIMAVDASSFVTAFDPLPEFEVSDTTALHMEADTPLPLATGTGPTIATPIRALWNTDCSAVKMVLNCSWAVRATGHAQIITSCNW